MTCSDRDRLTDLNHGVQTGEVLGPPVHALLVVLLVPPGGGVLVRVAGLHGDVGAVLHGDEGLLGLVPGGAGGRVGRPVSDQTVEGGHLPGPHGQLSCLPPVDLLPHVLSDGLVEVLVYALAGVVTNQREPPERSRQDPEVSRCDSQVIDNIRIHYNNQNTHKRDRILFRTRI